MTLSIYTLEEGVVYVVAKSFRDHYNNYFSAGEKLTYMSRNFSPYHDGHTIFFKERQLYLQEETNQEIIEAFGDYLKPFDESARILKPPLPPIRKKNARWEAFLYFSINLILVAIAVWLVFYNHEQNLLLIGLGWFGLVFFGLGVILSIRTMFKRKNK